MSYAEITTLDPNPIKRWIQRRRLSSAADLYRPNKSPSAICDYGAGNGELMKLLRPRFPAAQLVCYEPYLLDQASDNLATVPNIVFTALPPQHEMDAVFCLEVFEHLPMRQTLEALAHIKAILKPNGILIIGVPVEVGLPAIYRGCFRMARRYGTHDATFRNIGLAAIGKPPQNRPLADPPYHPFHMGFDFRRFRGLLGEHFRIIRQATSPFDLGTWLMPEVNFVAST